MNERNRGSKHFSLPDSARKRPSLKITLSPDARAKLEALAKARFEGNLSRTIEALIEAAPLR